MLIRCSFYAEQTPGDMSPQPLVDGVAQLLHRIFEGPIDGVNVHRSGPARRRRVAVAAPLASDDGRPRRPRGEQTRLKLLEAGASVLPARGYHDARVDDIVDAAGVSHGTFYRYFVNKDDFFRVLAEAASSRMIELIDRLRLDADVDDLRAWLQDWFRTYEADGGVISTWQEMQTNEELAAFSRQVAASVFTRLVRILEGRDFGNPEVDATMLLALIERVPYSVYTLQFTSEGRRHRGDGHHHPPGLPRPRRVARRWTSSSPTSSSSCGRTRGPCSPPPARRAWCARSTRAPATQARCGRRSSSSTGPASASREEHGGLGLGYLEVGIVVEELGRVAAPTPFLATATQLVPMLREAGSSFLMAEIAAGALHRFAGRGRGRRVATLGRGDHGPTGRRRLGARRHQVPCRRRRQRRRARRGRPRRRGSRGVPRAGCRGVRACRAP